MSTHHPAKTTTIRVAFLDGSTTNVGVDIPVYVERREDAHGARTDDGSQRAVVDLVHAGLIGDPDTWLPGASSTRRRHYIYYMEVAEGMCAPIAILPTETTEPTETITCPVCGTTRPDEEAEA